MQYYTFKTVKCFDFTVFLNIKKSHLRRRSQILAISVIL